MRIIILLCLIVMSFTQTFDEKDPRALIENVKIMRIIQELDLSTEQSAEFFPRYHEYQKVQNEFRKKQVEAYSEFKRLLGIGASDEEFLNVIEEYKNAYNKKIEDEKKKLDEMLEMLTPVQQAKYLIFEAKFEREILKIIQEIKERRAQP